MKLLATAVQLSVLTGALSVVLNTNNERPSFKYEDYPGFSLDLNELRLVQTSPTEPPVWMTELQKVLSLHSGISPR